MDQSQLNWLTNFIWNIADNVLRDVYSRGRYRDLILPMTVLRRLDAVLEPTKQAVLEMKAALDREQVTNQDDACVPPPGSILYRTGIATYVWVLSNRKPEPRRGQVQLIDATQMVPAPAQNMGKKNCELAAEDIQRICDTFLAFEKTEQSKIFPNAAFGYWKVKVERPLRLHSQLTRQRIETLRFASGDEEIRAALYDELGDALFENPASVRERTGEARQRLGPRRRRGRGRRRRIRSPAKKPARTKRKRSCSAKTPGNATPCWWKSPPGSAKPWATACLKTTTTSSIASKPRSKNWPSSPACRTEADHQRRQLAHGGRTAPSSRSSTSPAKPSPIRCAACLKPSWTARRGSSNTNPTANCATTSKSRCWSPAASKPSSAARCCPTRPTPGSSKPTPRSATRSASPATSTSRPELRTLAQISADILALEQETEGLLERNHERSHGVTKEVSNISRRNLDAVRPNSICDATRHDWPRRGSRQISPGQSERREPRGAALGWGTIATASPERAKQNRGNHHVTIPGQEPDPSRLQHETPEGMDSR